MGCLLEITLAYKIMYALRCCSLWTIEYEKINKVQGLPYTWNNIAIALERALPDSALLTNTRVVLNWAKLLYL